MAASDTSVEDCTKSATRHASVVSAWTWSLYGVGAVPSVREFGMLHDERSRSSQKGSLEQVSWDGTAAAGGFVGHVSQKILQVVSATENTCGTRCRSALPSLVCGQSCGSLALAMAEAPSF